MNILKLALLIVGLFTAGTIVLMSGDTLPDITNVIVAEGETLIIDSPLDLGEARIDGHLILNSDIKVQTLLVNTMGTLTVNSGSIEIKDVPFAANDPDRIGNGILVRGTIIANGLEKTPFEKITEGGIAGSSSLTLESAPAAWTPGDLLCLADTRQIDYDSHDETSLQPTVNSVKNTEDVSKSFARRPNHWEHETAIIESINDNVVTLSEPLQYNHTVTEIGYGHVGNLTRSIVFKSENPEGIRGHFIAFHGATVDITGVQFDNFGRTSVDLIEHPDVDNQNGRYAIHMHHVGSNANIRYCSVNTSPKWGIALHNTSYSYLVNNTVWKAEGAGIVFEDGNEVGNYVLGNYAAASIGSGEKIDLRNKGATDKGHEGTGFWFRGIHQAYINGNVSEGNYHSGFAVFQFPPPSSASVSLAMPNGDTLNNKNLKTYCVVNSFAHNIAIGGNRGFEIWNHNNPVVFENLKSYHNSELAFAPFYVTDLDLMNSEFYNDPLLMAGLGVSHQGTEGAGNMNLLNVKAHGFDLGVRLVPIKNASTIDFCDISGNNIDIQRRNGKAEKNMQVYITNSNFDILDMDWQGRWHWKVDTILKLDQTFIDGEQVFFDEQAADWGPVPETIVKERPGKLPLIQFEGAPEPNMTNQDMINAGLPPIAGEISP